MKSQQLLLMDKMEDKKKEPIWIKYIKKRVYKDNKNFLAITSGPTGSGKTWCTIAMCEMLDPTFNIERIVFNGRELMNLINSGKLTRGSAILWDEAQIDLNARNWQSITNKMLNYLISTFRHQNFILIFTSPYSDFMDSATLKLFHANFETVKINKKEKVVYVKPKLLQYNHNLKKWYRKYLKIITKKGSLKIKRWKIPKPTDAIIKDYENKKKLFTQELNQRIEARLNKLKQDEMPKEPKITKREKIKKLIEEIAQKIKWSSNEDLRKEVNKRYGKPIDVANFSRILGEMREEGFDFNRFKGK